MSRQLPIGESSYIPKSRKYHQKFILIGGHFDREILTLSRGTVNTTVFNIDGEVGRYAKNAKIEIYDSNLPALFWEEVGNKQKSLL